MSGLAEVHSLFAVTAPGLEAIAAAELAALGIRAEVEAGGVAWSGPPTDLHTANLHLRTASRVLVRVAEFRARSFIELERHARKIPWERFVTKGESVRFRVTSTKSKLYHEGAITERMLAWAGEKGGAVRSVEAGGADPDEETAGEHQLFVVRFHRDLCTVSADSSGELLHRRGYREELGKAPLRETLAAALLLASGWRANAPLLDPMCGSGTIPIEAALLARRIPPGLANPDLEPRPHRYRFWPDRVDSRWDDALGRAREAVLPRASIPIAGSDRDAGAVAAALANAERAGVAGDVELSRRAVSQLEPPPGEKPGWLVVNPPYGIRVGEHTPLRDLYAALGRTIHSRLPNWTVAVLSADPRLDSQLRIPFKEVLRTRNGGIPVRLVVGPSEANTGHG